MNRYQEPWWQQARSDHTVLVFVSVCCLLQGALQAREGSTARPNVVVVLTDDQGYGDLSCHGNPILKTPNMDAIHADAVRLTDFHVDPTCSPTRSALMTGRYSHRVGGWHTIMSGNMPRKTEVFMAEYFRKAGYRTGHFGKWHLGNNYPFRPIDRGFEEWLGHGDGGTGTTPDFWGNDRVNDVCIRNGRFTQPIEGFATDVFFDEAIQFIRTNRQSPFFVYLATYTPHSPNTLPDAPWAKAYRGRTDTATADFFSTIARIDHNLGRLRTCLEELQLDRNTILIFMTDNGGTGGVKVFNAGMRGQKGQVYDGGHRVPCFFRWPAGGLAGGRDVSRLTAHVDILPTLIDLCGLPGPEHAAFDGRSLRPLLENSAAEWPERTFVVETQRTFPRSIEWQNSAVMTGGWRLVDGKQLYDMRADPGQQSNVADQHPAVTGQLKRAYDDYWRQVTPGDREFPRPMVGTDHQLEITLTGEEMRPIGDRDQCAWNQAHVAAGMPAFGYAEIEVAQPGEYRFELRRWPRELEAPMSGLPSGTRPVDAWLHDQPITAMLYGDRFVPLPVARVQLKVGNQAHEAAVAPADVAKVFSLSLEAGPVRLETVMLDGQRKPLAEAYYVYIRPSSSRERGASVRSTENRPKSESHLPRRKHDAFPQRLFDPCTVNRARHPFHRPG
jgi:arylsulfatase A-like enzyme